MADNTPITAIQTLAHGQHGTPIKCEERKRERSFVNALEAYTVFTALAVL